MTPEEKRVYNKAYYAKNREKMKQQSAEATRVRRMLKRYGLNEVSDKMDRLEKCVNILEKEVRIKECILLLETPE